MEWEKLFSACPEAWNGLLVYPVLMRDYSLFLAVKDSILSAQQSWPFPWSTAKYWDGLFGMGLIPRLCLMLKLVFRLEERDGALPLFPKMNGEKLESLTVFQGEQTGVITAKNFGGLRELIARQNGLELPDETNNAELVEAKRYLAQQRTPPLKADFESLIYSVACALKTDPEELLNWTIRRFRATEQALDRSIGHLTASITLAAGGKFKGGNPYPSWKYDREETGVFETLDALSKRVDGTIEAR